MVCYILVLFCKTVFLLLFLLKKRNNFSPVAGDRKSPRVSRCFSPPPPDVKRVVRFAVSEEFYTKKQSDQVSILYSTHSVVNRSMICWPRVAR